MSDLGGFSLHDLFRGEAETHASALSDGLVRLEGTSDPSVVEPLMRAAHSIKGAARVIGLDIAVKLAHAMEDALVAMQKGREAIQSARIDQLLQGADLLASLAKIDESAVSSWSIDHDAAIDALVAQLRAPAPASTYAQPTPPSEQASAPQRLDPPTASPAPSTAESAPLSSTDIASPATPPLPTAATATTTTSSATSAPRTANTSVRVTAEKLDRLLQLAGESLLEARRLSTLRDEAMELKRDLLRLEDELDRLRTAARRIGLDPQLLGGARHAAERGRARVLTHLTAVEGAIRRGEETSSQLYHEVLSSRMRPFADATTTLARTVRDLSRQLGKEARLEIVGEHVPVDRDVLARLDAPLNHMLRNALDHGVETPDERRALGKPTQATLRVEARHHAGMLRIRVSDDGRGIDLELLRERIVRKALAPSDIATTLDSQELLEFLFLPGFSTAQQVTDVSGRGVGLDVVQSTVREIGGTAKIETDLGRGTAFDLELPITRSVIRAVLVDVAGETLAFPLARIERVLQPEVGEVRSIEGRLQVLVEGAAVGVIDAARVLALAESRRSGARENLIVIGSDDERFAVAVDGLIGEEDLVVRALDARLGKVAHLAAAAVRESGEPVLIVDTEDLLQSVRVALQEGRLRGARPVRTPSARRTPRALVVDDSATVREVERQLLTRMGFEVDTAVDGLDGLYTARDGVATGMFDLIISDIDMPRMNGIEFVRSLRADARFASVPIIIVSYKDREEDRLAGLEAGATAYLTKGAFQDSTFTDAVRDLVPALAPIERGERMREDA